MFTPTSEAARGDEDLPLLLAHALRASSLAGYLVLATALVGRRIAAGFSQSLSAWPMFGLWLCLALLGLAWISLGPARMTRGPGWLLAILAGWLPLVAAALHDAASSGAAMVVNAVVPAAMVAAVAGRAPAFAALRSAVAKPSPQVDGPPAAAGDMIHVSEPGVLDPSPAVHPAARGLADAERGYPPEWSATVADDEDVTPHGEWIVQEIRRARDEAGRQRLDGRLYAEFAAGQRVAWLHVGFCPPLSILPEVEAEIGSGESLPGDPPEVSPWLATVRVAQRLLPGARLEVTLAEPALEALRVPVDIAVWEPDYGRQ